MPTKVTLKFQMPTGTSAQSPLSRMAGWSESFWHPSNEHGLVKEALTLQAAGNAPQSPLQRRRAILPPAALIVAYAMQSYNQVGPKLIPVGGAEVIEVTDGRGTWPRLNDIPGMSLILDFAHMDHSTRTQTTIRGVPDDEVTGGEFDPVEGEYRTAVSNYMLYLGVNFGSIIIDRRNHPKHKIATISGDGLVTGLLPIAGINPNQWVSILRSRDDCGRLRGGYFQVQAVVGINLQLQLSGWHWGETRGGTLILHERVWARYNWDRSNIGRAVPRKVGAPFAKFVGRSRRRLR
jgi:hypothetical protein